MLAGTVTHDVRYVSIVCKVHLYINTFLLFIISVVGGISIGIRILHWHTANIVNRSDFNTLAIGSGFVVAVFYQEGEDRL